MHQAALASNFEIEENQREEAENWGSRSPTPCLLASWRVCLPVTNLEGSRYLKLRGKCLSGTLPNPKYLEKAEW